MEGLLNNHEEIISPELQLVLDKIESINGTQSERIEKLEKEMSRFKYIVLAALFALQSFLPNGLTTIIDILIKIP